MTKQKNKKRILWIVILSIVVIGIASASVLAYMFRHDSTKGSGKLEMASTTCEVLEEFDAETGLKSSVKIQNGSNIDCYVRLNVVSYWQDSDGNVMGNIVGKPSSMPTINYDTTSWLKDGDIYYYKNPVPAGGTTKDLLLTPMQLVVDHWDTGETVYQVVEIFAETVQQSPSAAVVETWGVSVGTDGKLKLN